jgi:thiol-disulfide isomerase/thioredoxin
MGLEASERSPVVGRFLAAAALVSVLASAPSATGMPPPLEHAQAGDPSQFDLDPWHGQVVLLDFWASWCAPCRQSFPWMAQLLRRFGDRGVLHVVAVNLDEDPEAAAHFLRGDDLGFVHLHDPSGILAERFGVAAMPTSILFDREGRPVHRHAGFHPDKTGEYERHIVDLLEGKADAREFALTAGSRRKLGVRPWERGVLATPEMQLICDPLEIEFDDHIYFSKEASSGGRGFGGGGCGCN